MILEQNQNFDFVFLGQSILKYKVPLEVFQSINSLYEDNKNNLDPANKQLVGKIENEHSLYYGGQDESKMKRHNRLPLVVKNYFMESFHHYLQWTKYENMNYV